MTQFNYSKAELQQGLRLQRETNENPETFAQNSGVNSYRPVGDLSKQYSTRMAGESGAFAEAAMRNPEFQQKLSEWNSLFGGSRMGNEFMASPPPNPHEMAAQQSMQAQQQGAA